MTITERHFKEKAANEILELLDSDVLEVQRGEDITFSNITNLSDDTPGICFINKIKDNNKELMSKKRKSFIIIPHHPSEQLPRNSSCWLATVSNPRLSFIRLVTKLIKTAQASGIDPTAKVHTNAKIGQGTFIGPFCVIGEVEIGENCFIDANVHIKDNVKIGNRVTIQSSTTIGGDGFGFELDDHDGKFITFPHLGGVIIGDDVYIGASTAIDRGALSNTIIEKNCRIDNLVHIAHNVHIQENTVIVAQSMIGGSSRIGKNCWISPGVRVLDGLDIGDYVTLGMGAVVMKDVASNSTYVGVPARSIRDHKKMLNFIKSNI